MTRALVATSSLCALLLLFLFMFTLLLMSVFGGTFTFCLPCDPLAKDFTLPLSAGGYALETDPPWGIGGDGVTAQLCRCDAELGVCLDEANTTRCVTYTPRANFDSFGVALVSTFQIFTGEEWQYIMYDGMRSNGLASVIIYVLFFLVGRYVLINMYLAIILACFATESALRKEAEERKAKDRARHASRRALSSLLRKGSQGILLARQISRSQLSRRGSGAKCALPPSPNGKKSVTLCEHAEAGPASASAPTGPASAAAAPPERARTTPDLLAAVSTGAGGRGDGGCGAGGGPWRRRLRSLPSLGKRAALPSRRANTLDDIHAGGGGGGGAHHGGGEEAAGGELALLADKGGATAVATGNGNGNGAAAPPARRRIALKAPREPSPPPPMTADEAALALQNKWRQHEARRMTTSMRALRASVKYRNSRDASFTDPLDLGATVPASNPSRKWAPPKFDARARASSLADRAQAKLMGLMAGDDDDEKEVAVPRRRYDFEYLEREEEDAGKKRGMSVAAQRAARIAAEEAESKKKAEQLRQLGITGDLYAFAPNEHTPLSVQLRRLSRQALKGARRWSIWAVQQRWFERTILALIVATPGRGHAAAHARLGDARARRPRAQGLRHDDEGRALRDQHRLHRRLHHGDARQDGRVQRARLLFGRAEPPVETPAFVLWWNWLDFFIVLISVIALMDFLPALKSLRALRALRALRPLRLVSRYPAMQLVVEAIFQAAPSILNVVLVLLLFWLVFGILGVQFFGGTMHWCVLYVPPVLTGGEHHLIPMRQFANKTACAAAAAELGEIAHAAAAFGPTLCAPDPAAPEAVCELLWRRSVPGFDNVPDALLTLFEVATLQGWPQIMHLATDAQGQDAAPQPSTGFKGAELYFLLFIILGAFIIIKLFAGVVIDTFNRLRDERSGSAFMSESQREWVETRKLLLRIKPVVVVVPPTNELRHKCFVLVTHKAFEWGIIGAILVNTCFMAVEQYPSYGWVRSLDNITNWAFSMVFALEAALKFIAFFPREYFSKPANCFDFVLVVASFIDIGAKEAGSGDVLPFDPILLRVLRIFRTAAGRNMAPALF